MVALPAGSLLVRTWFGDDDAWEQLVSQLETPSEEGFVALVTFVNDVAFEGLGPVALADRHPGRATVSFLADEQTLTLPGYPIVAVWVLRRDVDDHRTTPEPFRVAASELWSVESNIDQANLDWEDFAGAVDQDGVFRGFVNPDPPLPPSDLEIRGLAAARRMVQDMIGSDGARRISGERQTVETRRVLNGEPSRAYDLAARVSFWITHGAIAYPITVGGQYRITSSSDQRSRGGMFGYLAAIEGEYRVLDHPRVVEVTWDWHPPRPPSAQFDPTPRFLDWSTVLRFHIEPAGAAAAGGLARVTVTHTEVPVEWSVDVADFWNWNLEYMQRLLDTNS